MAEKVNILGVMYSRIRSSELMKIIAQNKSRIVISPAPVDSIMQSRKNRQLRDAYNSFDYVLPDGRYVAFASNVLGKPLPEPICGPDLFPKLLDYCSEKGRSVFFLGSDEETVEKVKKKLCGKNIKINNYCPPFRKTFNHEDNLNMIKLINSAKPDFLFVIFGAPKQDIWVHENRNKLKTKVIVPIGAAFPMYAGTIKRAPKWMQKTGLEWFFRMLHEPKLYKRYARDFFFPFLVLKERFRRHV